MGLLNTNSSLLLIIDIQEKLVKSQFNKEKVIKNASILAQTANILGIPTVVTEQYPQGLGNTIEEVKNKLVSTTAFFEKTEFDCCSQNGFIKLLKTFGKKQIFVCGMESHICVHQSVDSLVKEGYEVHIVQDVISSRNELEQNIGLQRMTDIGAIPTCTETVIFELLRNAKHPKFKEIQGLIK